MKYYAIFSMLDYNDNLCTLSMLMLYYIYVIVIYDGMCIRNMLNILCEDIFLTIMKT